MAILVVRAMEKLEIAIDSLMMTEIYDLESDRFCTGFSIHRIQTMLLKAFVAAMENASEDLESSRLCANFSTRKIRAVLSLAFVVVTATIE